MNTGRDVIGFIKCKALANKITGKKITKSRLLYVCIIHIHIHISCRSSTELSVIFACIWCLKAVPGLNKQRIRERISDIFLLGEAATELTNRKRNHLSGEYIVISDSEEWKSHLKRNSIRIKTKSQTMRQE